MNKNEFKKPEKKGWGSVTATGADGNKPNYKGLITITNDEIETKYSIAGWVKDNGNKITLQINEYDENTKEKTNNKSEAIPF